MNRFNFKIFKEFWTIAKLYWFGEEKLGAITLLGILAILSLANAQLFTIFNTNQGVLITSLSAKNADKFWQIIIQSLIILVVYVPLVAAFNYCQYKLGLYWRKWLTNHFLNKYFYNRGFYDLGNKSDRIDNPDQRIAEDIKSFTQDSLSFLLSIVTAVLQIIFLSLQLWKISQLLVWFLIIYSLFGTIATAIIFGKPLVFLRFEQRKKEANFRFGLVRIRENSESIAFYRGEKKESNQLKRIFNEVFENFNSLILWEQFYLGSFTTLYQLTPYLLPVIIVAPSILNGEIEVGKAREAQGAFSVIFLSLNIIVSQFANLTNFAAGVDRLYSFSQYLEQSRIQHQDKFLELPKIDTIEANRLAVENLSLQTPNYQKTLFRELSFSINTGEGILIVGESGCGKSSLLRAIAGLWDSGTGKIVRPPLEQMLFLPQRPYMILGTLRNQLLYPSSDIEIDDSTLYQVLDRVNLPDLAKRFGGLDIEQDWSDVLSLGEQQRLAFARLLLTKPQYAILDEATSALDIDNESNLYTHLKKSQTTFISVGHRNTLVKYHQTVLRIIENGNCQLRKVE